LVLVVLVVILVGSAGKAADDFKITLGGANLAIKAAMEKFATPVEKFTSTLDDLQQFASGGINEDLTVYTRGVAAAFDDLEKTIPKTEYRLSGAFEMGSAASVSAINQDILQRQNTAVSDPQERVQRVLQESKRIQERQAKAAEALVDVLQDWDIGTAEE
jgi:hypothetical protein